MTVGRGLFSRFHAKTDNPQNNYTSQNRLQPVPTNETATK